MSWTRAALAAMLVFLLLFAFRFATVGPHGPGPYGELPVIDQRSDPFQLGRRNYASTKRLDGGPVAAPFPGAGAESQKYEKIGSLSQVSESFDADRQKVEAAIKGAEGQVQLERATGLKGRRTLQLGIGVPPARFDAFIEAAKAIGRNTAIEIVKNDRTNEYLQLRAKRATLEKARSALEELKAGGGSLDERIKVQNRLTEVEQQIQDLGVSLGEFDSQNELCTVKLSLMERAAVAPWPFWKRVTMALALAITDFLQIGIGFLTLTGAAWIGMRVLREILKLIRREV